MIATLVPEPGRTPLADEYRAFVTATARVSTDPGVFGVGVYDPVSVREACARWKKRMADEYASTTVFAGLVPQLVEANATLDASAIVMRMAQDELRHAEICGKVVTAMGGTPCVVRDTTVQPIAVHVGCGPEERALRNVIVTAISETYSTAFFVASLDQMQDDYLRVITRTLLADEVLHGRFGFYYLQGWSDWLACHPEVRASISKYLRYVFAVVEREFVRAPNGRPPGADDDALGLVSSELGREIFESTMEQAVAPGLDRFDLDATRAWRTRSLGEG